MSWKERLESVEFTIVTGDGKEFKPLWKNSVFEKEFNTSKYDFINVEKSLITRKKQQSIKYPLVFWFTGIDNIDKTSEFEKSSNDNRLWTVTHPFYGTIKGQPVSIQFSDEDYNVTKVSVEFWESIDEDFPLNEISSTDLIIQKSNIVDEVAVESFVNGVDLQVSDINNIKENTESLSNNFNPGELLAEFTNIQKLVEGTIDGIIENTESVISNAQKIVSFPATFEDSLINKFNSYLNSFQDLVNSISSKSDKFYFESQGASIISGLAKSIVFSNENDFLTRNDVEIINDKLLKVFNQFLITLDENQVQINDIQNSWFPNPDIQRLVSDLVFFTSNKLFEISFNAKQERIIELEKDSNLIVLTHRFIGLDDNDENLELFRQINNITNNELFTIPKGRLIRYYV